MSILLGNGNGTFQPAVNYAVGDIPALVAVGDFNGDGKLDLAVANASSNTVERAAGQRRRHLPGRRQLRRRLRRPYRSPWATSTATASSTWPSPTMSAAPCSVLLGNGDGTFQTAVNYAAGHAARSVGGRRLQRRRQARPRRGATNVQQQRQRAAGQRQRHLQAAANFAVGSGTLTVAVADFNGDGKLDLAVDQLRQHNVERAPGQRQRHLRRRHRTWHRRRSTPTAGGGRPQRRRQARPGRGQLRQQHRERPAGQRQRHVPGRRQLCRGERPRRRGGGRLQRRRPSPTWPWPTRAATP